MSLRDDGGPAFPRDHAHDGHNGMTLRDYFIAHAPAEPWPEFDPVMPPRPVLPNKFTMLSDDDRKDWDNERLYNDEEHCSEALRQFSNAYGAAMKAQDEWDHARRRQRRIQWPAYWANQMLKARNA